MQDKSFFDDLKRLAFEPSEPWVNDIYELVWGLPQNQSPLKSENTSLKLVIWESTQSEPLDRIK